MLIALTVVVFVPLLLVSLWPDRVDDASFISAVLDVLHRGGLPAWVNYSTVERLANMALYIPVGAALAFAWGPRRWWAALGVAVAISVVFESLQNLLASRYPSWIDIVMNSLGALAGTALVMVFNERRARSSGSAECHDAQSPSRVRVATAPAPPTRSRLDG